MKQCLFWLASLVCFVALCRGEVEKVQFFPVGKELVYNAYLNVHSGIRSPMMFGSYYGIKAKLHLQGIDQTNVAAVLTDIVYQVDNGRYENRKNDLYLPIPSESEVLKLPFNIQFDSLGMVNSFEVEQSDKEWSINMKKAIASVFQVDHSLFVKNGHPNNRIHISVEPTIYGECTVGYLVNTTGSTTIFRKNININECNTDNFIANKHFADTENDRSYTVLEVDNHFLIDQLKISSHLVTSPTNVPRDVFVTGTFQKFQLSGKIDIKTPIVFKEKKSEEDLTFNHPLFSCGKGSVDSLFDITGGRAVYDADLLIAKVYELIGGYIEYFESNHITFSVPNIKNVTLLQKVLPILETFNVATLEKCYASIPEKTDSKFELLKRDFFILLLPHTGTHASARFIRSLVVSKKISPILAVSILYDVPENLKCVTDKLLVELEDLLTVEESNTPVHSSSVLAFSAVVRKAYENTDQKSPLLEKYINLFVQKFSDAKEYKHRVLYLEALSNIQIGSALKFAEKIVNGEIIVENNLRTLALYSLVPKLITDFNLLVKIVLPILADREANLDLRLAAYYIFVQTKQPTLNRFMHIHHIMRKETNEKFYNFHYSTLKSLSELECSTHEKCQLVKIAKVVLKLSRKPLRISDFDGTNIVDVIDSDNGFEMYFGSMLLTRRAGLTLRAEINGQMKGFKSDVFSLYVNGEESVREMTSSTDESSELSPRSLSYEAIIKRNGRTIFVSADNSRKDVNVLSLQKLLSDMGLLSVMDSTPTPLLDFSRLYQRIIANDLGVPTRIFEVTPVMLKLSLNSDMPPLQLSLKLLVSKTVQTAAYNPINDLWHGIQKINYLGVEIPLNIDVTQIESGFKIIFDKYMSDDNMISAQNYVKTQVFIEGANNRDILSQFHKDVDVYETVTRGDNYRKDIQIEANDYLEIGSTKEVTVYDCEQDISRGTFMKLIDAEDYDALESPTGFRTCGVRLRFVPLSNVSRVELIVEIDAATLVFGSRLSFQVKTKDNTNLRSYDIAANFSLSETDLSFNSTLERKDRDISTVKMNFDFNIDIIDENLYSKFILTFDDMNKGLGKISAHINGSYSPEEIDIFKKKLLLFRECEKEMIAPNVWSPITMKCLQSATSLRKYNALIDVSNRENYYVNQVLNHLKIWKANYYQYQDKVLKEPKHNRHYYLDVVFPVFRTHEIDLIWNDNETIQIYTGVPYSGTWFTPINVVDKLVSQLQNQILPTALSQVVQDVWFASSFGPCIIAPNYVLNTDNYLIKTNVSSEWQSYFKNDFAKVLVKNGENQNSLDLEINVINEQNETIVFQVFTKDNKLTLSVNEKEQKLPAEGGKYHGIADVDIWSVRHPQMLYIAFENEKVTLNALFDGKSIDLNLPTWSETSITGICVD